MKISTVRYCTKEERLSELMEDGYPEDITGLKFGVLEVLHKDANPNCRGRGYVCKCKCGNKLSLARSDLTKYSRKSCGKCKSNTKYDGDRGTAFQIRYSNMLSRCYNPKNAQYKNYGGRGIKVCDRWLGDDGYRNFKADMYEEFINHAKVHGKHDTSLDRENPDGNYCLENCRWVTNLEQQRNKRNTIYIDVNGNCIPLREFLDSLDSSFYRISAIYERIKRGIPLEDAISYVSKNNTLFYRGVPLVQYCREHKLSYKRVVKRYEHGWDIESAVEAPKGMRYKTWLKMKENNKNSLDNNE